MCSFSWPEVYLLISTTNQRDYLTGQLVKNLLAMQETQVRFLGGKDPLEKEMAYSCLENPKDRGAWWPTVYGVARVRDDLTTKSPPPTRYT